MFRKFLAFFTLQRKLVTLAILAALVPSLVLVTVVGLGLRKAYDSMGKDLAEMAKSDAKKAAQNVWLMVKNQDENSRARIQLELNMAQSLLKRVGSWSMGEPVTWKAVNQVTGDVTTVTLPSVSLGDKPLRRVEALNVRVPLVDDVQDTTGAYCTLFQRMNDQGDLLRIATNVIEKDKRAIGTFIPAIDPDGQPNPVATAIREGQPYIGRANVLGQWFMAGYLPLKDEDGRTFGAMFVGAPLTMMSSLRESVLEVRVGRSGSVYVMGSKGDSTGRLWIADEKQQDTSVINLKDVRGNYVVRGIIDKIGSMKPGQPEIVEYELPVEHASIRGSAMEGLIEEVQKWISHNTISSAPEDGRYIAAITYYPEWDWIILAQARASDYMRVTNSVSDEFRRTFWVILVWCVAIFFITLIVSYFMGLQISRPIEQATMIANSIATGQIGKAVSQCRSLGLTDPQSRMTHFFTDENSDEALRLRAATSQMALELQALIGRVLTSVDELAATSEKLSSTTSHQRETSAVMAGSTREVNSAVKQIHATSHQLLETIGELNTVSSQAAGLANTGYKSLTTMEMTMRDVDKATLNVSARLAVISQKTDDINLVVTTISKVAEQTNLLSVNAAIEAEKAGEYGMGFLVVAREIRRMADQTAAATGEIEQIVRQVQSAVSAGVMEMDRFTAQVNRGVGDIRKLSGQLSQILDGVRQITLQFENLTHTIEGQKRDVNRIVESMESLSSASTASDESTSALTAASAQLSDATSRLQQEASRFQVDTSEADGSVDKPAPPRG